MPTSPHAPVISLRPIDAHDLDWVRAELARNWGGTQISSLGVWHDADRLPGFIAFDGRGEERVGLLTHTPLAADAERGCEVITLSATVEDRGVGTHLLVAAVEAARRAGCRRIFLTTTNDNLRAIGFYQRRGWSLVAVHRGAMDEARKQKPSIPMMGLNGIPLRDELELEYRFA
ncbi:MAG: GNAT family N-acetyltransferase [Phycisphaerales bacterium]|nr:GNAT family N-acetyltransferase [Phycisphaerales bacterium]